MSFQGRTDNMTAYMVELEMRIRELERKVEDLSDLEAKRRYERYKPRSVDPRPGGGDTGNWEYLDTTQR